jgi:hypothetical protein
VIIQKSGWVLKSDEGLACCAAGWRRRWLTISGTTFSYFSTELSNKSIATVDITPSTKFEAESSFEFSSLFDV